MPIQTGSRLGPYEIVAQLGAGGMGEVWRAKDTRLDRTVAIKVLPAELAQDAQLRVRFEREARVISQLATNISVTEIACIGPSHGTEMTVERGARSLGWQRTTYAYSI